MKTIPLTLFVIVIAAALSRTAGAAEPPAVAVPDAGGAAFSVAPGQDPARAIATAKGSGARLVACAAASVAASDGAKVEIACGADAEISLVSGAFRIAVGSRGAIVRLGGRAVRARNARLSAASVRGTWVLRADRDGEDGGAAWAEAEPPSEIAPGEVAPVNAAENPVPQAELMKALETAMGQIARSAPRPVPLAPRRVESPDDLRPGAAAAGGGTSEVEVEAIEVEAGCIEVCVD